MNRHPASGGVRTVTAAEFKAKCLALFEDVFAGGDELEVTKHGRVVACLDRVESSRTLRRPSLAHYVRFSGDVESPIEVAWDASK